MARLRQQHPQSYGSSSNISTEFENVVRYLNAAELGNKTVAELLSVLFNGEGEFHGPVDFRLDPDAGLQFQVGDYDDSSQGWQTIVPLDLIRGPAGLDVGQIGAPIIHSRADWVAEAGQTVFAYDHEASDDLIVFVNGILQPEATYTSDPIANTITFGAGLSLNDAVAAYRIRADLIVNYRRVDHVTVGPQQVFAFEHSENDPLQVYMNGILLREGGSFDYTRQPVGGTITLVSPTAGSGDVITIIVAENSAVTTVTGLMLQERYCHADTGMIRFDRVSIDDDAIPTAKVDGLPATLAGKGNIHVSAMTPVGAAAGDLWLDQSRTPNELKFYTGLQWLLTSPESSLPLHTNTDAGRYLRVDNTGTNLEYAAVDFSSLIAATARGAANGVASLDSTGRIPPSQMPTVLASSTIYHREETPANTSYGVTRVFRQKVAITGIALRTVSGSCDIQVEVDGVPVGPVMSASSGGNEATLGSPIEIDAVTASKGVGFVVSGNASASGLEVALAANIVST